MAMTPSDISARGLATDLAVSIAFSTRLQLTQKEPAGGREIARASWALPIAGALIGMISAVVYWLALTLTMPSIVAAALTVTAMLLITGCLHEDGLADTADGFGGGHTRERKLEIMRDSRIGSYGACALGMSLILRVGALASIADPVLAAGALITAHVGARAILPVFMRVVPQARADGLAADAGRPSVLHSAIAVIFGLTALALGLPPTAAIVAAFLLLAAIAAMAWLCQRQIGGQTGDVLGALEQAGEILILLAAATQI